jgi:shikimate dehydrogenase
MFSAILRRAGIPGAYVPFKVDPPDIGQAIQSLRILHITGANVTAPHKETVIPYLDVLSEGANFIGAINTIVRKGSALKGYNTNAIGFMDALNNAGFNVAGKSALVIGTGGAAKAVVFILNWLRAGNPDKARQIAGGAGGTALSLDALAEEAVSAQLVINATSVSSFDESQELGSLVERLQLPACELLMDLNYGRTENFWETSAKTKGIPFMNGLPALAYQAKRSFALWTGIQVPAEEFLKAQEGEAF